MKLSLNIIKNMSDLDKILYWKFIKNFVCALSPTNLKKAVFILSIVPAKKKQIKLEGEGKECKQCLDFHKWEDFAFSKHSKYKKSAICYKCRNLNMMLYRLTNINARLASNLRSRINMVIKDNKKSNSTETLIGCSIEFLREYLESKFKKGMSWENYGRGDNGKGMQEWHIDHIIPCCTFDLSKSNEQHKCFHYTNLQPLWAKENWKKSGKVKNILN